MSPQEQFDAIDVLVQHEGMITVSANREAFLIRAARLLDVNVDISYRANNSQGVVHEPAGVGVSHEAVTRLQFSRDCPDSLDVDMGIAANLQLESAVSLGPVA